VDLFEGDRYLLKGSPTEVTPGRSACATPLWPRFPTACA